MASSRTGRGSATGTPPRGPRRPLPPAPKPQPLPHVRRVVVVGSGKGGVGKSTVSTNLAVALATTTQPPLRVGLLDADVYGPSLPRLMHLSGAPQLVERSDGPPLIRPLQNHGVHCMSMGFLLGEKAPLAWRGLMVMKALEQLTRHVAWDVDVLIVDLPPGTGDVPLSLAQTVVVDGAVIVSTPQDVALADAYKGLSMFEKMGVPVLGLIQNMSHYTCTHCGHHAHLFGHDGVRRWAERANTPLLGSVPLTEAVMQSGEDGTPIVIAAPQSDAAQQYRQMAGELARKLGLDSKA
ncbi:hypothetical protein CXG81DRAFT_30186 [Caulochytrium protostelioides]|uniref:P-loop containing nucleoside triphosphate hydrolase protein n=1 Tax=Caulochytrium protostelioides TaxID=1555241 RepID=A0A4V1IU67_9FUNG|nr:hypothetical protein CXG81DRAFT_30186 [Caulochytrium protostelioides]|eukprot:RKO99498.1 hypothetical protein CXG81DRAFT_30186 [Caulochytrium protostelioides]